MTSPATRRPTGRFTIHQSGTDQARIHAARPTGRVVHAVRPTADQLAMRAARKVAVHHTAEAPAAAARVAQAARAARVAQVARAIQAAKAVLAAESARADTRLYARCFGAAAAAHDVPVSAPTTGTHADASTMTRAEQDALYDALFGKGS